MTRFNTRGVAASRVRDAALSRWGISRPFAAWPPAPRSMMWCWRYVPAACAATSICKVNCPTRAWWRRHRSPCARRAPMRMPRQAFPGCAWAWAPTLPTRCGAWLPFGRPVHPLTVMAQAISARELIDLARARAVGGDRRHQQDAALGLGPARRLGAAGQLRHHQRARPAGAAVSAGRAPDAICRRSCRSPMAWAWCFRSPATAT